MSYYSHVPLDKLSLVYLGWIREVPANASYTNRTLQCYMSQYILYIVVETERINALDWGVTITPQYIVFVG